MPVGRLVHRSRPAHSLRVREVAIRAAIAAAFLPVPTYRVGFGTVGTVGGLVNPLAPHAAALHRGSYVLPRGATCRGQMCTEFPTLRCVKSAGYMKSKACTKFPPEKTLTLGKGMAESGGEFVSHT